MDLVRKSICILLFSLAAVAGASAQSTCAKGCMPLVGQVAIPPNCQGCYPSTLLTMNPALNLIYVSGGFTSQQYVSVVDGSTCPTSANGSCTFSIQPLVHIGSAIGVDLKNDNYWAPEVYSQDVMIYDGSTNMQINKVPITSSSFNLCPGEAAFNGKSRIMWVGAQCGGGNDPVFAIDADTFKIVKGPIGSGGIMSTVAVNPTTGRLYVEFENPNTGVYGSEEVNPKTYLVTPTSFGGNVYAINPVSNLIYAVYPFGGTDLQIVNGSTEKVLQTIALGYTPTFIADNNALHHLYLGNPTTNSIEVRNDTSGLLIPQPSTSSFPLPAGATFTQGAAVDSVRGRLYVTLLIGTTYNVYAFEDLSTARICQDLGTVCGVGVGIR
jgi:DNA-binding beta-propeller fold protein YncE